MKKFDNYCRALATLEQAPQQDLDNEFVQGGVIDKFFIQFELGWKLFKDLLAYEGAPVSASGSPREIIKASYQFFDFVDEGIWLSMLRDRNNTAHVYDEKKALQLIDRIIGTYIPEFVRVRNGVANRYSLPVRRGFHPN